MPAHDRQAFLDVSELRYGDPLDSLLPRQRTHRPSALRAGDDPQVSQSVTTKELATVPARGPLPERSSGGLPGEITHFTGRDGPMAELRARIAEQTPQGAVVTIYAMDGMAGVGKTAFARHAAQEFAKSFPDGAIWVDLYGHTPGMAPREPSGALEQMLLQLGLPLEAIKADPVERRDQWRHYIHGRRMLIVLDNVLTSDQVLPLLPEAPSCLVLITSRRKLTGLTDAYPLSLDVLEWDEAERLFIKLVGQNRCEDRDALRQILAACGRLPLAIRLIAGRLRHHRDELLTDVAADLADETAALDALEAEHLSIRAAFEWSYRPLTDAQRHAFRLLGWHPGPAITPVVSTAIADVPSAQGRRLLRELVDHNLLEQLSLAGVPGGPRYRMHDLVRLYARERANAEEPPTERAAAINRLAGSYLAITREADRSPHGQALTACQHLGDQCGEVDALWGLGEVERLVGEYGQARTHYTQALTLARQLGHRRGEADALWGLGQVERLVAAYGQAREYLAQALTLARQLGYRFGEADALWGLGQVERLVGEYGVAREDDTQALILARQLGYRRVESDALRGLGEDERLIGEYRVAREYHTQALILARQLGYRRVETDVLRGLGHVERSVGEYGLAREYHTQALTLARQFGDRRGEAEALCGLGYIAANTAKRDQACEVWRKALEIYQELTVPFAETIRTAMCQLDC